MDEQEQQAAEMAIEPLTSVQKWDNVHADRLWGTCPEPWVARWAMRRWREALACPVGPAPVLMEIGCGVGPHAIWLGEAGFTVNAFDASEHAIERARERNKLPHTVRFMVGEAPDYLHLAPQDYYDGVYDVCCLQHVEKPRECVDQIVRVLRPGGCFLSIFADSAHSMVLPDDMADTPFWRLDERDVWKMFVDGSWTDVKVERASHTDQGHTISHWIVMGQKIPF